MTSISLLNFLKFFFISIWYIKNYFQFKNNCITRTYRYFLLNMYITENANKFYKFFCEG